LLDRDTGATRHASFADLWRWLRPRSLLILNDTRVIAARLIGRKPTGGASEVLLVRPEPRPGDGDLASQPAGGGMAGAAGSGACAPVHWRETWQVLAKNLAGLSPGARLDFGPDLDAELLERGERGAASLRFLGRAAGDLTSLAERIGSVPLPPYIVSARRRDSAGRGGPSGDPEDRSRYQTVYARTPGAVAAPTAGLHFTQALLDELRARGHDLAWLTLHVGPGTFRPVEVEDPASHVMDEERFIVPEETAAAIRAARADGRPIVAVGTTVVRTLEGLAAASGEIPPGHGATRLFVVPGFRFRVVTDLITNFHLPRSTLLMLVAAFAGRAPVLAAYAEAVAQGYRFYSYGDAMLIRPGIAGAR
jgi:S-adenosylmethionine:tRNA ribosyltransferase-isomerase